MPSGMTKEEVKAQFNFGKLLGDRIQDLLESGLVREHDSELKLTAKGHALILPFILLRKSMGLSKGKG